MPKKKNIGAENAQFIEAELEQLIEDVKKRTSVVTTGVRIKELAEATNYTADDCIIIEQIDETKYLPINLLESMEVLDARKTEAGVEKDSLKQRLDDDYNDLNGKINNKADKTYVDNQLNGKADEIHSHFSSQVISMNGYTKPQNTSNIQQSDSLNEAIGKLERALDDKQESGSFLPTTGGNMTGHLDMNNNLRINGKTNGEVHKSDGDVLIQGTKVELIKYNTNNNFHVGGGIWDNDIIDGKTYLSGASGTTIRCVTGNIEIRPENTNILSANVDGVTVSRHLKTNTFECTGKITTNQTIEIGNPNSDNYFSAFFKRNGSGAKVGATTTSPSGVEEPAMSIEVGELNADNSNLEDDVTRYAFGKSAFVPHVNNTLLLGTNTNRWKEAHITDLTSYNGVTTRTLNASGKVACQSLELGSETDGALRPILMIRSGGASRLGATTTGLLPQEKCFGIEVGDYAGTQFTPKLKYIFGETALLPDKDSAVNLGISSRKFNEVHANVGNIVTSDSRLKENIEYINSNTRSIKKDDYSLKAYNFIKDLKFARYNLKENIGTIDDDKIDFNSGTPSKRTSLGFIAQDVVTNEVGKNILWNTDLSETLSYSQTEYINTVALALQNSIKEIESLKTERELKDNVINDLVARLESLENKVQQLETTNS